MTLWTAPGPAGRSVIALLVSIVLLAGALGLRQHRSPGAVDDGAHRPVAATRPVVDRQLRLSEYAFHPNVIAVPRGARLRLTLINAGREEHEIEFEGYGIEVAGLHPGTQVRLIFDADRAGRFEFACHLPGHYERGMRGLLIVHPHTPRP